jgi:hypothetical protein
MVQDTLLTVPDTTWDREPSCAAPTTGIEDVIESGRVVHLPALRFGLREEERAIIQGGAVRCHAKNISMRWTPGAERGLLRGAAGAAGDVAAIGEMLERFSVQAGELLERLFPAYRGLLRRGNASFRPIPLVGRKTSWRQDDSRLHVDAFPSNPLGGLRLLRVFTNIDTDGTPRVWRLGEPFPDLVDRYRGKMRRPLPGSAWLLHRLRITKQRRSLYDYAMLQLHDLAKGDVHFQRESPQQTVAFAPGTSWIVFSDQVLHAAVSGRNLLEHTFLLHPAHQKIPHFAPVEILRQKLDWWNAKRPPPDRGQPQPWWSPLGSNERIIGDD